MPELHHTKRPAPARWIIVAVIAALVAVLGTAAYAVSVLFSDEFARSQIDLIDFTTASPNPDWPYLDDATDRTSEVCGSQVDCVQAVGNEYLTLLKFDSVKAAREYTETLGSDGVQVDPLVIHFDGTPLSTETREDIVYSVSNINVTHRD